MCTLILFYCHIFSPIKTWKEFTIILHFCNINHYGPYNKVKSCHAAVTFTLDCVSILLHLFETNIITSVFDHCVVKKILRMNNPILVIFYYITTNLFSYVTVYFFLRNSQSEN